MTLQFKKNSPVIYLIVFVLLFFAGCESSSNSSSRPTEPLLARVNLEGDFVHSASGMVFPPKVGNFESVSAVAYNEKGTNVSVEYTYKALGFNSAKLVVYIYPVPENSLDDKTILQRHYLEQKNLLLDLYPDAYDVGEGNITIGQMWGKKQGRLLRFKRKSKKFLQTTIYYEKLYVFEHGPWFIKYRVTNPAGSEKEIESRFGEFMHLLHWPKLKE
ncbi:MAG: hypothetical protein JW804_07535 [Sedimentisphaerales bacterium]|nr:hypothetical protein [Sedimentisphaerales bacterium]